MAKIFGVYCKEFAIGMGPKLFSKKFKETEYSVRALLIGGFVSMVGEQGDDPNIETLNIPRERTLKGIAKWKQTCVMFAGIFMNILLAWLLYSLLILNIGTYTTSNKPIIESIREDMPAYNSGLQAGDIIVEAQLDNGMQIRPNDYSELSAFLISYYEDGNYTFTVERDGKEYTYSIEPEYYPEEDRYIIGITFNNMPTEIIDINLINCFKYGFIHMITMIKMIFTSLSAMLKGIGLQNLSGPIGVYQVVEQTIDYGFAYYIELLALVSTNVAVFNALPIPAFDGGRVLLLLIEVTIRRPLPKKFENIILTASFALILMFMVLVSYNDIVKIIGG